MKTVAEKEFKIKVKQRGSIRATVTKTLDKVDTILTGEAPDIKGVKALREQLKEKKQSLKSLDEAILLSIDDSELDSEIERSEQYQDDITTGLSNIQETLDALSLASVPSPGQPSPGPARDVAPKLPKLEIPKFNGDPLSWDEFWDNFSSSIHERQELPTIDKFKYLKSFLTGEALSLADGYRLTNANYIEVVQALKERFGDPELATFSHFEALIALRSASYNLSELRSTFDKCESHIRSLVALGLPESTFGIVFTPLILSKLPKGVKIELHRKNGSTPWRLDNLRSLLKEEINAREKGERIFAATAERTASHESSQMKPKVNSSYSKTMKPKSTTSTLTSTIRDSETPKNVAPNCIFCSGAHYSSSCSVCPDIESRLKRAQGRCHCCLRTGHRAPECRSKRPCFFCKRDTHHQSLCRTKFQKRSGESSGTLLTTTTAAESSEVPSSSSSLAVASLSLQTPQSKSILQTALTTIKGQIGHTTARLYFDTGGSRSFISASTAKKIGAKYIGQETVSVGRFRDLRQTSVTYRIFEFDICFPDGKSITVRMSSEAAISCPIQLIPLDPNCPILSQVKLAEPLVNEPSMVEIDVLIGNDYYYTFIGQDQIRCSNGVVLLASPFGFVAGGLLSTKNAPRDYESSLLIHTGKQLNESVERFWRLEDLGIKEDCYGKDDEAALRIFNETVQYEDERYHVQWPWKEKNPELPSNYGLALGRLRSLVKRIQSDEKLLKAYNANILEQQERGIIEVAPAKPDGLIHYIPHHCVVKPSKTTTKLRIVYDASAKGSKSDLSLNETLHRGPVFLANSIGIILRWRLPAIAMVSDIEKAFLQVGLQMQERDATRFLWLKDIASAPVTENITEFRFCRVPFGVISSPFLLAATIAHHLKRTQGPLNWKIADNVYVDNVFGGASNENDALQYYRKAKALFAGASMNLREWFSNSRQFMNSINESDQGRGQTTSVLGLEWNLQTDVFSVQVGNIANPKTKWTKRYVLQAIASVFDPCGYFSPVTINGKLLMQQLWKSKREWDEPLHNDEECLWVPYLNDLIQLANVRIPRRLQTPLNDGSVTVELHCYCDASAKAYSAVVYLKATRNSISTVDLIFSKTRVAPIKPLTVPRLELLAVLVGTRCVRFIEQQLHLTIAAKYIWTDSSCVLHWIAKDPVSTVFVQNRLREIKSLPSVKFQFVPTADNPADLPSRGVNLEKTRSSNLWWHGPDWLQTGSSYWPNQPISNAQYVDKLESPAPETFLLAAAPDDAKYLLDPSRFSNLERLLRVTSYVFRFIRATKSREREDTKVISAHELEKASRFWDKNIQAIHFPTLFHRNPDRAARRLQYELGLFADSQDIIRCRGRYVSEREPADSKYPKLMPKNNTYTDLIIRDRHEKLLHSGVKHTLAEMRQDYWVIHGRNQVKRVLKGCNLCRYYHGGAFRTPPAPPLPEFRLSCQSPFQAVGLDYLGPLLIRDHSSQSLRKVWICLFTCAAIRAIHLEVVDNLNTEQFLLCLRRFVAKYGCPRTLISDNAKQFHTAEKLLTRFWREILQSDPVQSFSSSHRISWKFITELAPWMGGFYERLIGLVKSALKKSVHRKCLSLTELQTLSCEISSVLNSRPLLYNEATKECNYLSPAHFLCRNTGELPTPPAEEEYQPLQATSENLILSWKRTQAILKSFWNSWQTSYLQSLQGYIWKPKNRNSSDAIPKIGTVVLIKDKPLLSFWKLGVINELVPSNDNVLRSANVRLASGNSIRRPLKLLFPLEYSTSTMKPSVQPLTTSVRTDSPGHPSISASDPSTSASHPRSTRAAASEARLRIRNLASAQASDDEV